MKKNIALMLLLVLSFIFCDLQFAFSQSIKEIKEMEERENAKIIEDAKKDLYKSSEDFWRERQEKRQKEEQQQRKEQEKRQKEEQQQRKEAEQIRLKKISAQPESVQLLLKEKEIRLGLTKEQVILSRGIPKDIHRTIYTFGIHEQWIYEHCYLYFENDILTSIQD